MSDATKLALEVLGDPEPRPLPESGSLVIGSSSKRAGLVLEGEGVAAAHCAIGRLKDGGWALKDLGSAFGSMVNGQKVTQVRLAHGDVIVLGQRNLRVVDPERRRELVLDGSADAGSGERLDAAPPAHPPTDRRLQGREATRPRRDG